MDMNFTGERYVPQLRGQIYYEHFHRYSASRAIAAGKDVLDIASGEGYGSAFLAMVARSVIGVDVDEASVQHAAARYPAMNLSFRVGSASQIPIPDASIDVITSFETIEHLVEHEKMLQEMTRVLRPDGYLVISSPNKLVYSDQRGTSNPFHVRELYYHEFRDLLLANFAKVDIYGQRIFAASAIHAIGYARTPTHWLGPSLQTEESLPDLPQPEYFVAVCGGDRVRELPSLSTVYIDPRDELLDDVRSGGLMAPDIHMKALPSDGQLALAAPAGSAEEERLRSQVLELEALRGEQAERSEELALECRRLTEQCTELEQSRRADLERMTRQCAEIEERCTAEVDALKAQSNALEAARAEAHMRGDRIERAFHELRKSEALLRLQRENFKSEIADIMTQLGDALGREASLRADAGNYLGEIAAHAFDRRLRDEEFVQLLERHTIVQGLLEHAVEDAEAARIRLESFENSRSWRATLRVRDALSRVRGSVATSDE